MTNSPFQSQRNILISENLRFSTSVSLVTVLHFDVGHFSLLPPISIYIIVPFRIDYKEIEASPIVILPHYHELL